MNTDVHYQQPSAPYQQPYFEQAPVMTVKDWILTFIVSAIPLVNIIMLFVWAFGDTANPNKKNYAKASLILAAVFIVLYALIFFLFVFILGQSFSNDGFF